VNRPGFPGGSTPLRGWSHEYINEVSGQTLREARILAVVSRLAQKMPSRPV
jgi:hypothetical protein